MLNDLNTRLGEVKENLRLYQWLLSQSNMIIRSLEFERTRLIDLERILKEEGHDVEKLEGLSLVSLIHTILGNKDEQLETERKEFLAAKLKYDESKLATTKLEEELEQVRIQLAQLGPVESQYLEIFQEKEKFILSSGNLQAKKVLELSESLADSQADERELNEVLDAGRQVFEKLNLLIDKLDWADKWGAIDVLGGKLLSTALKQSKIGEAKELASQVQTLLRRFVNELQDVGSFKITGITIDVGTMATIADYFIDGFIIDIFFSIKIGKALRNSQELKEKISETITSLDRRLKETQQKIVNLHEAKRILVEEL